MTLALLQTIIQSVSSTLYWMGLSAGIRALPGERSRRRRWMIGSAVALAVWLIVIVLAAGNGFLDGGGRPPPVIAALVTTLAAGYLLLLSPTFRDIIARIPPHWLIAIQTFRILGGGVPPGLFAPLVAYWWVSGKPYARRAAIAWNLFGMADLINAVLIGALTGGAGGGIVFPLVLIPAYAVPRAFLLHSYSLIGLLRGASQARAPADRLPAEVEGARA